MRKTFAIPIATLLMIGITTGSGDARSQPERAHFAHLRFEQIASPQPGVGAPFCVLGSARLACSPPLAASSAESSSRQTPLAKAADFKAAIAELMPDDPESPGMLSLRLDYVDFLSRATGLGCEKLLAAAQSQLDLAAKMPAIALLPAAPARLADGEYRIHLSRATCGAPSPIEGEFQEAIAMARRAVQLYQNASDYSSATVMQLNVAAAYRELGQANEAVDAIKTAIAMDREYGFRKDADENTKLLVAWTGRKVDEDDAAARTADLPAQPEKFQFNWPGGYSDVTVNVDDTSVIEGAAIHSRAAMTLKRHVLVDSSTTGTVTRGNGVETADVNAKMGWTTVTNELGKSSYEQGLWPPSLKELEWPTLYFMASELYEAPTVRINADGDFHTVADPETFAQGLSARLLQQITSRAPASEWYVIRDNLGRTLTRKFIEAKAAQDYGLQTATWIGAKLEQGIWYRMATPLLLPGLRLGRYLVQHDIRFAFTRDLPCTANATDRLCAEIVIHAAPDPDDLRDALQEVGLSRGQTFHVWASMDMRLIVDPDTLFPYVCETTQNWYDGVNKTDDPIIESVRTVSTSTYPM